MDALRTSPFSVELTFHGDLPCFLTPNLRNANPVVRTLSEKSSIKDVIEACGVPHTEIDLIVVHASEVPEPFIVDFSWSVHRVIAAHVHPAPAPPLLYPAAPRLQTSQCRSFVADGHLGKLARNLRLLGFDTSYSPHADDNQLLRTMLEERRAVLTRDRRLLMHSIVKDGYCPRSSNADAQTREVLHRFHLTGGGNVLQPFTRCLRCNGILSAASKSEVTPRLVTQPKTLRFYDKFHQCNSCGQIYWPGSHFTELSSRLNDLLNR